jgi:hypothetical protein
MPVSLSKRNTVAAAGLCALIFAVLLQAGARAADDCVVAAEAALGGDSRENQRFPAAAGGGGVHLVVWQEGWNGVGGDAQIKAALVRPAPLADGGAPVIEKSFVVCAAPDHQEAPQVAFGGGVFLVVWHDFRNGGDADIYGARVTPEGKVLDPEGIPIAARPRNQNFPALCGNGRDFLVVWREVRFGQTYDLMAARVESKSGRVLDEKGVRIASDAALPAAGFTGSHYVIAWLNTRDPKKGRLQFCRYDPNSLRREEREPVDAGHADAFSFAGQLKLVSGSGEALAVWARGTRVDPWGWGGPGAMLSLRIRDDGVAPENKAFNKIRWSPEGRRQYVDRLLPGVLDCARWKGLPGWPQGKPGGFKEAEGGLWPFAYLTAVAQPGKPGQYAAAWTRVHLSGLAQTGRMDIAGGRLRSDTALETPDEKPFELSAGPCSLLPVLSAGAAGEPLLLVYESRDGQGQPVVKGRFVSFKPIP